MITAANILVVVFAVPLVTAFIGYITNWAALQMIFRPLEPKRYAGLVTYQGMFPSRQDETAADYGRITAREILTPADLIRLITEGDAGSRIAQVVLTRWASASTRPARWSVDPHRHRRGLGAGVGLLQGLLVVVTG